jgi:tetratricopeptide (TPR) repeat protein
MKRLLAMTIATLLVAGAHEARAQKGPVEEARAYYKKGEYLKCLEALDRAQKVSPDPHLFWNMAACEKKLGRFSSSIRHVERYLAGASDVLSDEERKDAERFLAAAKGFVATVTITSNVDGATITIDGESLGTTPLARPIVIDEGDHTIRFAHAGYTPVERHESARAGAELRWTADLERDRPPTVTERPRSLFVPAILAGSGVAALGTGAIFVGISIGKSHDVEAECAPDCPPARWEKYRTLQRIGDVLLIGGGALVAAGVAWYIVQPFRSKERTAIWVAPAAGGIVGGGTF